MPGGGGIRAMMHLANVAPRDGSVIGLVHSSVPFAPLYGTKARDFDPRQMSWIGSHLDRKRDVRGLGKRRHHEMVRPVEKEFIVGGTGAGSQMETLPTC